MIGLCATAQPIALVAETVSSKVGSLAATLRECVCPMSVAETVSCKVGSLPATLRESGSLAATLRECVCPMSVARRERPSD